MTAKPWLIKISSLLLGAALLLPAFVEGPAAAEAQAAYTAEESGQYSNSAPAEVQDFARQVVQALAQQEAFHLWRNSISVIDPLGPGTHGWLVSLAAKDHTPTGYLIITAKPEGGLALAEYGAGPDPLYNPAKLPMANDVPFKDGKVKLEPIYGGPTLTQWRMTTTQVKIPPPAVYIEASGGEPLPDIDADWAQREALLPLSGLNHAVGTAAGSLKDSPAAGLLFPQKPVLSSALFQPDDNLLWMSGKAVHLSAAQFQTTAAQPGKWVFFSSGASRTYAQSLPISGYQLWTKSGSDSQPDQTGQTALYLISRQENRTRYLLFDSLTAAGEFKAWPKALTENK